MGQVDSREEAPQHAAGLVAQLQRLGEVEKFRPQTGIANDFGPDDIPWQTTADKAKGILPGAGNVCHFIAKTWLLCPPGAGPNW